MCTKCAKMCKNVHILLILGTPWAPKGLSLCVTLASWSAPLESIGLSRGARDDFGPLHYHHVTMCYHHVTIMLPYVPLCYRMLPLYYVRPERRGKYCVSPSHASRFVFRIKYVLQIKGCNLLRNAHRISSQSGWRRPCHTHSATQASRQITAYLSGVVWR